MWRILPSCCRRDELAELVLERHLRVDAVQLEQVDPLEAEVAQAQLDLLAQVLRAADRTPVARAAAG